MNAKTRLHDSLEEQLNLFVRKNNNVVQDVPKEELEEISKTKSFSKIKKPVLISLLAAMGLQIGGFFYNKPIKGVSEDYYEIQIPSDDHILRLLSTNNNVQDKELPKVHSTNPSWYALENQPLEAIIKEIEKTDIRVRIGSDIAKINENEYKLDAAPYIKDGRTLVPLRFIAEGLGASVGWDGTEKKVTLDYEGKTIELWIGKKQARINGIDYSLDVAPEITKGRTFVPIRFIAENFGSQVGWDSKLKEVSIIKEKEYNKINENSDADKDGLIFKDEKNLGTNPNDKNTIYNSLNDKKLFELKTKYPNLNIFADYPDGITKLTLPEKALFELNPTNAFNLDQKINDEIILKYALNVNPNLSRREELDSIWQEFNTKYNEFIEPLKANLNLETTSIIKQIGDKILNFKNLGLEKKLNTIINEEFVKNVITNNEEYSKISPIVASFKKEFVDENKEYFKEINNSELSFIASMLEKYPLLTIEKQAELKKKYPELDFSKKETFENPDKKTNLSLEEKLRYNINPLNPNNFDDILTDKNAIEYAKTKNLSSDKESVLKAVRMVNNNFGQKLGTGAKQLAEEKIISVEELDNQAKTAKTQVEEMYNNRAYKKKADGSKITIDDLTSVERYKLLMALNKTFKTEEINILLSQSPTLQKEIKNLNQYEDLIKALYNASNKTELFLNKKVKETNTFNQNINQLSLYDNNASELILQIWKENDEMKNFIKSHPKTTLALASTFSNFLLEQGKITLQNKEYNLNSQEAMNEIKNIIIKLFGYFEKTEEDFRNQNVGFSQSVYHKEGIESYTICELQGLAPITSADIFNNVFASKLNKEGVVQAISLFDVTELLNQFKDISSKYRMKILKFGDRNIAIDWLNPEIGAASVRMKLSPYPIENSLTLIEGNPVFEGDENKEPRPVKSIAEMAIPLLKKEYFSNAERIRAREIEIVGVQKLINIALLRPVIERVRPGNKTNYSFGTGSAKDRMDAESEKLAQQFLKNANIQTFRKTVPDGEYSDANFFAIFLYNPNFSDISVYREYNSMFLPCRVGIWKSYIEKGIKKEDLEKGKIEQLVNIKLKPENKLYWQHSLLDEFISIDKSVGNIFGRSSAAKDTNINDEDKMESVAKTFIPYPGVKL